MSTPCVGDRGSTTVVVCRLMVSLAGHRLCGTFAGHSATFREHAALVVCAFLIWCPIHFLGCLCWDRDSGVPHWWAEHLTPAGQTQSRLACLCNGPNIVV